MDGAQFDTPKQPLLKEVVPRPFSPISHRIDGTLGDRMDEILHQLSDLFLRSVPTVVLFLLLLVLYRVLVHGPLLAVLAERRARTIGAVERAHIAIQAADAKAQEYEAKLRAARAEIFRAREQRVQAWNRQRDAVLEDARHAAGERVKQARAAIEAEAEEARKIIDRAADTLAADILKAILPAETELAGSAR
jgi:F-type H+-transporting ATPase subunit b